MQLQLIVAIIVAILAVVFALQNAVPITAVSYTHLTLPTNREV